MKNTGLTLLGFFLVVTSYSQTKKIVFVCEHGSAKSVIAATYFNKLAKEKNIPWEAVARGTDPDTVISLKTKQLLIDDNLYDANFVPQILTQQDVNDAQRVILFYKLPHSIKKKNNIQHWKGIDAVNRDFLKLRDDIVSKITPVIDSLSQK